MAYRGRVDGFGWLRNDHPQPIRISFELLSCNDGHQLHRATATTKLQVKTGIYDIVLVYFDISGGVAKWEAYLDNRLVGKWQGDNEYTLSHAATQKPDGGSKARITFSDVHVKQGNTLKIVGVADSMDTAPLDYVAVSPRGIMD